MELRQYLLLLRKWAWLLILGAALGAGGTYFYSTRQPLVFQTTTRVMIIRGVDEGNQSYSNYYNDLQLMKTYPTLISTEPVMRALSDRLGYDVIGTQVSAKQIPDSLIIDITVKDGDAERAAEIANTLPEVFLTYNEDLQKSRFATSEESLQAQIQQVDVQIKSLQSEMEQLSAESLLTQQEQVEAQIAELETEIAAVKTEIARLTPETPMLQPTPEAKGLPTLTPEPTAMPDAKKLAQLEQKQNELGQLEERLALYQQIYLNLTVLGQSSSGGNQNLRMSQVQTTLALYQQIYTNLLSSYENVRLARLRSTPNVVQLDAAKVPGKPIQPLPLRDVPIGAVSGLLIMGAIAFLVEYLDDTLKTPEDVARALGLPVIGMIGEMDYEKGEAPGVYVAENPRSPIAEAFRTLRTNLEFAGVDRPIRSLLVTSASPSEGKTTLAINLAASLAQGERRVMLIDADLRRPAVHRYLGIPNRSGLTELFRPRPGDMLIGSSAVNTWGDPALNVITSGSLPPNPAELLGSERMCQILEELKEMADIVVVDGPPFIVADPVVMASRVDGVLLVIEPGGTKVDIAQGVVEQLQRAGARVVGVVLNPISRKRAHYYYGKYRYYSDYYYSSRSYGYYSHENGSNGRRNGHKSGRKVAGEVKSAAQGDQS